MTLDTTKSYVPHIYHAYATSIHESQISLRFALQPAVSEIQAILRQVNWMTPKWHWTPQGHMCHIYVTSIHEPQISLNVKLPYICISIVQESQISLYYSTTRRFRVQGHFETSAPNNPNGQRSKAKRSKVLHVWVTSFQLQCPKFHSILLCCQDIALL